VSKENIGTTETATVEEDVLTDQNYAYRSALLNKDLLFAAIGNDGRVSAYGFVLFDTFYKRILGEAADVPMIGNCYTFPSQRQRGLYTSLLVAICKHLADRRYERVIISCAPDNLVSIRGIQRAGFSQVNLLRSIVVFSRWVVCQKCTAYNRSNQGR
jgi:RimJ/RimL family protein N-acetyltransferase